MFDAISEGIVGKQISGPVMDCDVAIERFMGDGEIIINPLRYILQ